MKIQAEWHNHWVVFLCRLIHLQHLPLGKRNGQENKKG